MLNRDRLIMGKFALSVTEDTVISGKYSQLLRRILSKEYQYSQEQWV
ncbi:MAG: hypothetical protein F6K58_16270 [Symploca sp. SIO2E9]|nr:hypothetical protein [Symploca sp. SIO2E9]